MRIYTIGFTSKTAEDFFGLLNSTDAAALADIRLNNNSQLAGFTKKTNLGYFVDRLTRLSYVELPQLAPEREAFRKYRADGDWDTYEARYLSMLVERDVLKTIDLGILESGAVLLCSEPTAERCHRRLAAEYLRENAVPGSEIVHL